MKDCAAVPLIVTESTSLVLPALKFVPVIVIVVPIVPCVGEMLEIVGVTAYWSADDGPLDPWKIEPTERPPPPVRPAALETAASSSAVAPATLLAPDGSGTVDTQTRTVVNGSPGNTIAFTYHPQSGVVVGGTVVLTVPKGWTQPTTTRGVHGYVQVSRGKATVTGRQISVAAGDLRKGPALTITYENGRAPAGPVGSQVWRVQEQSSRAGKLRDLASSPAITVLAPDGSGRLQRASGPAKPASSGNTVVFTYTAGNGGMSNGTITITVPPRWSPPSSRGRDPGCVTASAGSVRVSGRTISITGVTLNSGQTLTIVYGSRSGGGAGAKAPAGNVGPSVWPAAESSSSAGRLTPLRG